MRSPNQVLTHAAREGLWLEQIVRGLQKCLQRKRRELQSRARTVGACVHVIFTITSPNQVLTHAARAAFQPPLMAARGAREGLWLEQTITIYHYPFTQRADLRFSHIRDYR